MIHKLHNIYIAAILSVISFPALAHTDKHLNHKFSFEGLIHELNHIFSSTTVVSLSLLALAACAVVGLTALWRKKQH